MCDFIQELKNDHLVIQQVVAGMSVVADPRAKTTNVAPTAGILHT